MMGRRLDPRVKSSSTSHGIAYFFIRRTGAPVPRGAGEFYVDLLNGNGVAPSGRLTLSDVFPYHDSENVFLGHAGWDFLFNGLTYMVGSLENLTGSPFVFEADARVAAQYWHTYKRCTRHSPPDELLDEMRRLPFAKQQSGRDVGPYTAYCFKEFRGHEPNDAEAEAIRWDRGSQNLFRVIHEDGSETSIWNSYSVIARNCLDNTVAVLNAYKASMPRPLTNAWFPNDYFDMLVSRGWNSRTL
jgi:hypothetical protein